MQFENLENTIGWKSPLSSTPISLNALDRGELFRTSRRAAALEQTRVLGLSVREVTVHFDTVPEYDRQTDEQTGPS